MNGVNALIKGALQSSLAPSTMRTQGEGAGYEPGSGSSAQHNHAGALLLGFPAQNCLEPKKLLQNCEQQISVVRKLPSPWYFIITVQTD